VRLQKKLDSNFYYMHTEKLLQATNLQLIATRILELHKEGLEIFACCTREDQHEYNYINARQTSARRPVARALHQPRLAPGQPVSPLDFSSVGRTGSRRASGHYVSRRDYSSSGLHRLYCAYAVHPDAPSRRSTCRQSVALALAVCPLIPLCVVITRLAAATDILHLRRASGCLGTSRASSSTFLPTPRVRVPRHVARLVARTVVDYFASRRLVVDFFAYVARPGTSARCAARHASRRRLLRLRRASGCLGTPRRSSGGSSRRSSSTSSPTPCV
jgi:hypothetical protein